LENTMRIIPFALIALGVFGVLKHYGLIDPAFVHLFWPLLLIGIGVAMLARGPRWRADMHERMNNRMQDRWERRMHRRFGPGWANLSEDERERFRAGMRQGHVDGGDAGSGVTPSAPTPARDGSTPSAPGQQR
jgi:Domain of unknown function (DUF5668)